MTFLGANLLKVFEGGWVPLALGGVVMLMIVTPGGAAPASCSKDAQASRCRCATLVADAGEEAAAVVPGTAVFLTSDPDSAPTALLHSLKHYKVLHEHNVILTVETADTPRVDPDERVQIDADRRALLPRHAALRLHGDAERAEGARDRAEARLAVRHHVDLVLPVAPLAQPAAQSGMPRWQDRLFIQLARRRNDATDYFQIPTGRVVEIGTQVTV